MCIAMPQPAPDAQVRDGLFNICLKMLGEEDAGEAMLQLEAFRRKEGCFGSRRALTMVSRMPAYQWWSAHVSKEEAGELRSVALKVNSTATYVMPVSCHYKHGAMSFEELKRHLMVISGAAYGWKRGWVRKELVYI